MFVASNHDNHFKEQIMDKYPVITAAAENPFGVNQNSFSASLGVCCMPGARVPAAR